MWGVEKKKIVKELRFQLASLGSKKESFFLQTTTVLSNQIIVMYLRGLKKATWFNLVYFKNKETVTVKYAKYQEMSVARVVNLESEKLNYNAERKLPLCFRRIFCKADKLLGPRCVCRFGIFHIPPAQERKKHCFINNMQILYIAIVL